MHHGLKPELTMPATWKHRPGTYDADIFRSVVSPDCGEYRLSRLVFEPGEVFIDVGAHIGSAAFAARQRGADHILCYEPCPKNFELLKVNVGRFAECNQKAVWGNSDLDGWMPLVPSTNPANTGGNDVFGGPDDAPVAELIPLDEILSRFESVAFLKLDCEGAEFPIIFQSELIPRCEMLAIEYHCRGAGTFLELPIPDWAAIPGLPVWTGHALAGRLVDLGFEVEIVPDRENLGKIFAQRK